MATHFHTLRISRVIQETPECVVVSFDVPSKLRNQFSFTQGQHLTLKANVAGEELRRNYSLCSSPLDEEWTIAIKKMAGGRFSTWANENLEAGMMLEVMPPAGHFFTNLHPDHRKNYLAIAAGSGITPILSIISTTLRTEPKSEFTLVYGNRNKNSIIFKESLEALKDKFIDRFRIIHILSREGTDAPLHHGRIDAAKCRQLASSLIHLSSIDECFLCGPEQMIADARDTLVALGMPAYRIHFELFTTGGAFKPSGPLAAEGGISGPTAEVTIRMDGIESTFPLAYQGQSILDAALQQGSDLPYACKGGVCCTCKAKLLEGEVHMDVVYGLEPDEIAAGYVLTCQSHPLTPVVKVDYDS